MVELSKSPKGRATASATLQSISRNGKHGEPPTFAINNGLPGNDDADFDIDDDESFDFDFQGSDGAEKPGLNLLSVLEKLNAISEAEGGNEENDDQSERRESHPGRLQLQTQVASLYWRLHRIFERLQVPELSSYFRLLGGFGIPEVGSPDSSPRRRRRAPSNKQRHTKEDKVRAIVTRLNQEGNNSDSGSNANEASNNSKTDQQISSLSSHDFLGVRGQLLAKYRGQLFVWGENENFCLGLMEENLSTRAGRSSVPLGRVGSGVGSGIGTTSGTTSSTSNSTQQQLICTQKSITRPKPLNTCKDFQFQDIACGLSHTIAVSVEGDVIGWGSNTNRQLLLKQERDGNGNASNMSGGNGSGNMPGTLHNLWTQNNPVLLEGDPTRLVFPTPLLLGRKVRAVACGAAHSMCLTDTGAALGWGLGKNGQLGIGYEVVSGEESSSKQEMQDRLSIMLTGLGQCSLTAIRHPMNRDLKEEGKRGASSFAAVACGFAHTMLLDSEDRVWACGWHSCGQVGVSEGATQKGVKNSNANPPVSVIPTPAGNCVPLLHLVGENAQHIACGGAHTLMVGKEGSLYGCGSNNCGQLGFEVVDSTSSGGNNARRSSMQAFGTAGAQSMFDQFTKIEIKGDTSSAVQPYITLAACGEEYSFGITRKREVYGWGLNNVGQLCLDDAGSNSSSTADTVVRPRLIPTLTQKRVEWICCTQEKSVALCEDGSIIEWGRDRTQMLRMQMAMGGMNPGMPPSSNTSSSSPTEIRTLPLKNVKRIVSGRRYFCSLIQTPIAENLRLIPMQTGVAALQDSESLSEEDGSNSANSLIKLKPRQRATVKISYAATDNSSDGTATDSTAASTTASTISTISSKRNNSTITQLLMGQALSAFLVDVEGDYEAVSDCCEVWEDSVSVRPPRNGIYDLHVWLSGQPVWNSPLSLYVGVGDVSAENSYSTLRDYRRVPAGVPLVFYAVCKDSSNNYLIGGDQNVKIEVFDIPQSASTAPKNPTLAVITKNNESITEGRTAGGGYGVEPAIIGTLENWSNGQTECKVTFKDTGRKEIRVYIDIADPSERRSRTSSTSSNALSAIRKSALSGSTTTNTSSKEEWHLLSKSRIDVSCGIPCPDKCELLGEAVGAGASVGLGTYPAASGALASSTLVKNSKPKLSLCAGMPVDAKVVLHDSQDNFTDAFADDLKFYLKKVESSQSKSSSALDKLKKVTNMFSAVTSLLGRNPLDYHSLKSAGATAKLADANTTDITYYKPPQRAHAEVGVGGFAPKQMGIYQLFIKNPVDEEGGDNNANSKNDSKNDNKTTSTTAMYEKPVATGALISVEAGPPHPYRCKLTGHRPPTEQVDEDSTSKSDPRRELRLALHDNYRNPCVLGGVYGGYNSRKVS